MSSILTPLGMYINEPPLQTAVFRAAYLLSLYGITLLKYSLTISGYFFTAVSVSQNSTPCFSSSTNVL